jgi:biopolymer transport protein ExbD
MAGSSSQDDAEGITGINVTPLVDVMLVLLIIFMVTANYIVHQSIKVSLPQAATGDETPATNLAFVVDKDSHLFLNGEALAFEDVGRRVAALKAQGKPLQALIGADKATPHGAVIKLIDSVRQAGIYDFAINVEVQP